MDDQSDANVQDMHEDDYEDIRGDLTSVERTFLPTPVQEPFTTKGEIEKLARFFAELPETDEKVYFHGFLNQQHQFGFYDKTDLPYLMAQYEAAECAYIKSIPSYVYTRTTTTLLRNIRALFYSLIRGSIGISEDITNQRTALNQVRINRGFNDNTRRSRPGFFSRLAGGA